MGEGEALKPLPVGEDIFFATSAPYIVAFNPLPVVAHYTTVRMRIRQFRHKIASTPEKVTEFMLDYLNDMLMLLRDGIISKPLRQTCSVAIWSILVSKTEHYIGPPPQQPMVYFISHFVEYR